ncbi:hypothetical protein PV328_007832 [Microctonus aethiopoides]|uniref:Uncharacterized protein n=1 Tax=Microctonus aethiopoides TaxID=144406 RepID=A0AA39C9J6_9HYME|nr:hypothetical protein PV328_007832 [Microctonus aethiopoides]
MFWTVENGHVKDSHNVTKVRLSIGQKGFRSEVLLLHDNVKHHTAAVTQRKLAGSEQRFTTSEKVQQFVYNRFLSVQYVPCNTYPRNFMILASKNYQTVGRCVSIKWATM